MSLAFSFAHPSSCQRLCHRLPAVQLSCRRASQGELCPCMFRHGWMVCPPEQASPGAHPACRWVWLGVGVLIFANLLFLTITILAHQFLDSFEGSNTTVSEDMLNERAFAAKGHTNPNAGPEEVIDIKVRLLSIHNCEAQEPCL